MSPLSSPKELESLRGIDCFKGYEGQRAAISFTGGKDCHLALQRSRDAGLKVVCLAVFRPPSEKFRVHAEGPHREKWQRVQASAMGLPLVMCSLSELESQAHKGLELDYKAAYAAAIRKLQEEYDISVIITGDVDYILSSTENFKQQVCKEHDVHGVQALLPLWQQPREDLLTEMIIKYRMDIRMTCVKAPHFDGTWIGRKIDTEAIAIMATRDGLDLNGENGEYHTMVVDGAMYGRPLKFENVQAEKLTHLPGVWVLGEAAKLSNM